MEEGDWESSSSEFSDTAAKDEDLGYSTPDSLPELLFKSDVSKARWNNETGITELVLKKGKLWTTTGIVRNGKTYCSIEETLYLVELGALTVIDEEDTLLSLKDLYAKMGDERNGCCLDLFEVYRYLKSFDYIVGRHDVVWSVKGVNGSSESDSTLAMEENNGKIIHSEVEETIFIEEKLRNLQVDELRLDFDVYHPNSKFRKSSPGYPAFFLCLIRGSPPSGSSIKDLEMRCGNVPLKLCHVDNGRVSFFFLKTVELPTLP